MEELNPSLLTSWESEDRFHQQCCTHDLGTDRLLSFISFSRFFAAFDCNRDSLLPLFGSESKFTFVVVGAVSPRARAHGYLHSLPNQKKLHADAYNSLASRNVMRQGLSECREMTRAQSLF